MITMRLPCRLLLVAALALAVAALGVRGGVTLAADGAVVRSVVVSPGKILANGGQATVRVTVSGTLTPGTQVTLSTTLGAFGSASGPSRIALVLEPTREGESGASATLAGDGRRGTAAITARVGESVRSGFLVLVGRPATVAFEAPLDGAVLNAAESQRLAVRVRDADGTTVPGVVVQVSLTRGDLATPELTTDLSGLVVARFSGTPGSAVLRAAAGDATSSIAVTLHGEPVSLQLLPLRRTVNLGDAPFPAPPGTLVAILLDDGGRPVPGVRIAFSTDRDDVVVLHTGSGESSLTDAGGRASGHLSAAAATQAGRVVVLATAGDLSAETVAAVFGRPAAIEVTTATLDAQTRRVRARVTDADGAEAPTGFRVLFSASAAADADEPVLEPTIAEVRDGVAETVVHLPSPQAEGVVVRATLLGVSPSVSGSTTLTAVAGLSLSAGLNVLTWTGEATRIEDALAPIRSAVVALWRYSASLGWQGYFPNVPFSDEFTILPGDRLYLVLSAPTFFASSQVVR